jgi:hypothetical protein
MEYTKSDLNWLMRQCEMRSQRYMDDEELLLEIMKMPFWKRLFLRRKIINHMKRMLNKYSF